MNNEPVAWIGKPELQFGFTDTRVTNEKESWDDIPLYTHPVKELHLSLQKSKQTGELLAVTYTDDEHRIVEVLWQRPPVKELTLTDAEINDAWKQSHEDGVANSYDDAKNVANQLFNENISLRNYFAAKAMQGLIAGCYAGNNVGFTVEGNVFAAYEYADAMMDVRKND
jgi:hypothetical protein